jgi:hypothetical protein
MPTQNLAVQLAKAMETARELPAHTVSRLLRHCPVIPDDPNVMIQVTSLNVTATEAVVALLARRDLEVRKLPSSIWPLDSTCLASAVCRVCSHPTHHRV